MNTNTATTVINSKHEPYDVYIGRPSIWGNPYKVGVDGTRPEVLEKFRRYAVNNPELMSRLDELRGRRLGCWCKPKACHGDILAELADSESLQTLFE